MKNLLLLLLFPFSVLLSAQTSEEKALENLIETFFNSIFSDLKTERIPEFLTEDFVLFEDGENWNYEKTVQVAHQLKEQFTSEENKKNTFQRINSFQFIHSEIDGNTGWIYYENFADFTMDGASISKMHWLESAVCVKTADGWKIRFLHSSPVKKKTN
ncbi:nuclear transport factor 2 family protein [Moheibacter lacus]|uniref:Nuclear transport factor 2 family protein n=1 Tax=Moheibacter lacus TaxID=2745851 RepID=A0A838ZT97_9FLAO|nr:nuclear transport factor 2 family protein [Moheibacter lacus]MBA5630210.1 nuclear transport factor 2 family protein [Moheibacter lacus]